MILSRFRVSSAGISGTSEPACRQYAPSPEPEKDYAYGLAGGGRRTLRPVSYQAALVASHHNPVLKAFAARLRDGGIPHKVVMTAVARKLVTIVNALCKSWVMVGSDGIDNTVAD